MMTLKSYIDLDAAVAALNELAERNNTKEAGLSGSMLVIADLIKGVRDDPEERPACL
jgi:hypothetical protein